jgi:hypothetical protein
VLADPEDVMMKRLMLLAALLFSTAADAQTVCVILNGGATAVLGSVPCGPTYNPPATTINASDARWTNYLGLQGISATAAALLQTGVTMTFTTTTSANDSYPADADSIQTLLNMYTVKGVRASALVSAKGNAGAHNMGNPAYTDLYNAVVAYNAAVLAAQATAIANGTAPVWPVATATSTH